MFWRDLVIATQIIECYGLRGRLYDLGGEVAPCIADYELAIATKIQEARYVTLNARPFDHIDASYVVVPPRAESYQEFFSANAGKVQTLVSLGVLEQVKNPAEFFASLARVVANDALIVIGASFSYPFTPNCGDYWRFSPDGLAELAKSVGLTVLESGWSLELNAAAGVLTGTGEPQEVKASYIAAASKGFVARPGSRFKLPQPYSNIPAASALLAKSAAVAGPIARSELTSQIVPAQVEQPQVRNLKNEVERGTTQPECIFVNTYYGAFLEEFYNKNPKLQTSPYQEQLDALLGSRFGDSDFYSAGLRKAGWKTEEIIVNCAPLQTAWAREYGAASNGEVLAVEQIARLKPDVIYVQDMHAASVEFLAAIRPIARLIVGQIASQYHPDFLEKLKHYDIVISSFPHYVARFRELGVVSYYQPLSFSQTVFEVASVAPYAARQVDVSFVGGISPEHQSRFQLMEHLARETPLKWWGYGINFLPAESPLRGCHQGEAWGANMFGVLGKSKITINAHSDTAEHFANNMRLFEATGFGALLITDYKDNLNELFEVGKEIVAYRSKQECAALVNYYLTHPEEAAQIAAAGQARTFKEYNYDSRMLETAEILERHLNYLDASTEYNSPDIGAVSTGYQKIDAAAVKRDLTTAWQSEDIPARQRRLVQRELAAMYCNKAPVVYTSLAELSRPYIKNGTKLLEIGCSSGYYFEVLEYLLNKRINYTGLDYSAAMVEMGRRFYPRAKFIEGDASNLPFNENEFDLVVSGCVILHLPNYREHIKESARVAKRQVIFHRTPLSKRAPTQTFKKLAYGVETVELRFNEQEFLELCAQAGLNLVRTAVVDENAAADQFTVSHGFLVS